jgi:hypothetical protein
MIRGPDGRFKAVTWRDALAVVAEVLHQVKPEEITGVAGKLSDAESMMALKDFVNRMGSDKVLCEGNGPNPPADLRSNYLMNTSIAGLEKADLFLLVGTQVKFSSVPSAISLGMFGCTTSQSFTVAAATFFTFGDLLGAATAAAHHICKLRSLKYTIIYYFVQSLDLMLLIRFCNSYVVIVVLRN